MIPPRHFIRRAGVTLGVALLLTCAAPEAGAQVIWGLAAGGSWNTPANWSSGTVPNAADANATFNGAATASNPDQTANRTIPLDAAQTVGSIVFNNDLSTFTNSLTTGTAGTLTFDAADAGPATITTMGTGIGNNTISVPIVLTDSLTAIVNNTTASSAAGSLNLTAAISGAGGFTKQGDGLATFGTGAKTYTGPTALSGGRTRISQAAHPSATSSFTINSGAQLELITNGTYTFGGGTLTLNGSGATSGPFAAFPGAIRPTRAVEATIANNVLLQTDTLIHMQATAGTGANPATSNGALTLSGSVSGPGRLTFTAPNSDIDQGYLVLTGSNTYSGGTLVSGGILRVSGANATLGTGNVTVSNAASTASIARLSIQSGVLNAIVDTALLSLSGGGAAGVADQGFADLGLGVNEFVGGLVLGGVARVPGTYGSTASSATFRDDEYFAGLGIVTVVPEPGSLALVVAGTAGYLALRRRRGACRGNGGRAAA